MRLLILSFYFPPDLCAGSFRCGALVEALARRMPEGMSVDAITTQPNRYRGSITDAPPQEDRGRVHIERISLPEHDSGMADQARSFATFARNAIAIAKARGPYDAVFATSSRLMTASLGAWISKANDIPLYLDIRDLFAETIGDVLGRGPARVMLPAIDWIERLTFRRAETINVVSPGFRDHIVRVAPSARVTTYTNGIDEEFMAIPRSKGRSSSPNMPLVLYAGNIGEGQGLHHVLPAAARELAGQARFRIVGHGGRLPQLREAVAGLDNVQLVKPVPRDKLLAEYEAADMLLLHLNDHPAFLKVLPSKVFEYGALGLPIVAGLAGVSAEFMKRELPDAAVFEPCDSRGLAEGVRGLAGTPRQDRTEFLEKFAREHIMDEMADDIIAFTTRTAPR